MAKKKKPVDAEFNTIDMEGDKPVESPVQTDPAAGTADKAVDATGKCGAVSDEILAKLEQFETLQRAVSDLTSENEALKDKLAEYVQRLRDAEQPSPDLQKLRDENDQYLMRISELTFENAKAQAQIDQLKKQAAEWQKQSPGRRNSYAANVYRGASLNGYSSWN